MPSLRRYSSFWFTTRNDNASKCTISIAIVASLALVSLVAYFSYSYTKYSCLKKGNCHMYDAPHQEKLTEDNCLENCMTKDCIHAANNIMEKIDSSIDPCVDFYQFACGNWKKKFGKKDNASVLEEPEEFMKLGIKEVLDEIQPIPGTAADKLKTVYESCMSKSASELSAVPTALKFLSERLGIRNWPHLAPDFRFTDTSLEEVIAASHVYELFTFFQPGMDLSGHESTWNIGNRTDPNSLMNMTLHPRYALASEDQFSTMKEVSSQILSYFGVGSEEINQTVTEFLQLNMQLNEIRKADALARDQCYANSSFCTESQFFLNCSLEVSPSLRFICEIMKHYVRLTELGSGYTTESIVVNNIDYFPKLYSVIGNFSQRTMAHHLALSFLADNIEHLNFYFFRLMRRYPKYFRDSRIYPFREVRWRRCVEWATRRMPSALALAYVPRKLTPSAREEINDIFEAIKEEVINIYEDNGWMDASINEYWKMKMIKVVHFLEVYLNYTLDEEHVNEYYRNFNPTKNNYLMNILEFKRHNYDYLMKRLIPFEKGMFDYDPFIVNAHHMESRLDLLLGVLSYPIYIFGRPRSLNLASLGTFIGHEFGHEMDKLFNNVDDPTFMSLFKDFVGRYKVRRQCLVDQYGRYKIEQIGKHVNGTFTFSENFGDYFAMVLSEKARQRYLSKLDRPEKPLPVPYTVDKAYYIAFAQIWCSVRSDESAKEHYEMDYHSPPEFRVQGSLDNSAKFSEVFNCPPGSPMNPEAKCSFLV